MSRAPSVQETPAPSASGTAVDVTTYYTEAGMDYRAWSRGFNMHFGFWRRGMNPFALENMLEEMSRQVFERLDLRSGMRVLDLGCGLGAPARTLVAAHPVDLTAVTIVPSQIETARTIQPPTPAQGRIVWKLGDYNDLDLPTGAFDAAFSIEAACHSRGASKEPFVRECARLLGGGAKLVVADGFLKRSVLPGWYASLLGFMSRRWAVERFAELPAFTAELERHGFTVLHTEDISWRIAPSVLHIPRVTLEFLARELLLRRRWLNRVRWGHVVACLLAPCIGLGRPYFGYYVVTAERR